MSLKEEPHVWFRSTVILKFRRRSTGDMYKYNYQHDMLTKCHLYIDYISMYYRHPLPECDSPTVVVKIAIHFNTE